MRVGAASFVVSAKGAKPRRKRLLERRYGLGHLHLTGSSRLGVHFVLDNLERRLVNVYQLLEHRFGSCRANRDFVPEHGIGRLKRLLLFRYSRRASCLDI